jgi:hypothetical protein
MSNVFLLNWAENGKYIIILAEKDKNTLLVPNTLFHAPF